MWLTTFFTWLRATFPGVHKFFAGFFSAMDNSAQGHALKKWLAVGFFWVIGYVVVKYTNKDNYVEVLLILVSTLMTLVGIYTTANYKERKLQSGPLNQPKDEVKPETNAS